MNGATPMQMRSSLKKQNRAARMHEALHQTGIYDFFERNRQLI